MRIKDATADKKYFTMVPNFILNHSSGIDQALYLQMKRLIGDGEGVCYASEKYFRDKLKIGRNALKNSIQYLLEHKWIEEEGYREVETKGGTQKVKTYLVKDIWKMNMDFYAKGVSQIAPLEPKGVPETAGGGVPNDIGGVSQMTTKKNQEKKNTTELSPIGAEVNKIISFFEGVNPQFQALFPRKHERVAAEWLLEKYGMEKCESTIKALPAITSMPYAPRITTPRELKENMGKLISFYNQEKSKINKNKIKVLSY